MKKYLVVMVAVGLFALSACENGQESAVVEEPATVAENVVEEPEIDETDETAEVVEEDIEDMPEPAEEDIEDTPEPEEEENSTENIDTISALQNYVDERGAGIAGGFEARTMTNFATVEVAGDNAVAIAITLEDEFVQTLAVTLDFLLATLEEEIDAVMPIFSQEAENVEAELGIDDFHFIIKFLLSTGDAFLWRSIYANEIMGELITDFSFLE